MLDRHQTPVLANVVVVVQVKHSVFQIARLWQGKRQRSCLLWVQESLIHCDWAKYHLDDPLVGINDGLDHGFNLGLLLLIVVQNEQLIVRGDDLVQQGGVWDS